jgi:hypothetical protein
MFNIPKNARIVIGDTTPNRGVFLSDNHKVFLSLLPKELTIENINKGSLSMRDYNGNIVPFSPVQSLFNQTPTF